MNQVVSSVHDSALEGKGWRYGPADAALADALQQDTDAARYQIARSGCYRSWKSMLTRVSPAASPKWRKLYKGIGIQSGWEEFENFFKDMGPRPVGGGLRRRDESQDFSKGNCYWYVPKNPSVRSKGIRLSYCGRPITVESLAKELAIDRHHLYRFRWTGREVTPEALACLKALQRQQMGMQTSTRGYKLRTINQWADIFGIHASKIRADLYNGMTPAQIAKHYEGRE